jgi:hypothetical protein
MLVYIKSARIRNSRGGAVMTGYIALERSIREILFSQKVAVLAIRGEEYPHACLVAFALTEDISTLVFVTSLSTGKYANIQESNRVTLLVDTEATRRKIFMTPAPCPSRARPGPRPYPGRPFQSPSFSTGIPAWRIS